MIKIVETVNNNGIFWFDIGIALMLQNTLKENEVDKLDKNILSIPPKLTTNEIIQYSNEVENIVKNFAQNTIKNIATDYNCTITKEYTGKPGKNPNNKLELSFAYYFTIDLKYDIKNISTELQQQLNTFNLRISNHLSIRELRSLYAMNNIKTFSEYMVDLYKPELEIYTENIFNVYDAFIDRIENYPHILTTFEDIDENDIKMVKEYAAQGDFPELK